MKKIAVALFVLVTSTWALAVELSDDALQILITNFAYDVSFPLNARLVGTDNFNEYKIERIVFDSFHNGAVPGFLVLPITGNAPYPVVLLMHGITSNKSSWLKDGFSHGSLVTKGLLDEGYAVMALDAQYHGERSVYNDYIDVGDMVFRHKWRFRYANMMTQSIVDYRRAIDYLASREDIDINRVGINGYSMGGHMTFILAANEPRVKAVVGCVVPATPGWAMEALTFAPYMDKTALLMMMARKDIYYTVEDAQKLYDRVAGKNKTLKLFNSGHSLPPEYAGEVVDWLSQNL